MASVLPVRLALGFHTHIPLSSAPTSSIFRQSIHHLPVLRNSNRLDPRQLSTSSTTPLCCARSIDTAGATAQGDGKKKTVVFLGTPHVAATSLETLYKASQQSGSTFSIRGVVTQPPAEVGRKRVLTCSPVHQTALSLEIDPIFTPEKANEADFLAALEELEPDLCVTAAYGNFLPTKFLRIPRFGTLNIHPSLLPAFRGAAPVPRALEQGVEETGVSILFTVLKMDAGPVVAKRTCRLTGDEQAPDLLAHLFDVGTQALLDTLPTVWDGSLKMEEQDDNLASHASKLSKDEGRLSFVENAQLIHNKIRALAGWPGTWADFVLTDPEKNQTQDVRLKVLKSIVLRAEGGMCFDVHNVTYNEEKECLQVTCGDGSMLGVLQVQAPGKKATDARSFWNGLRGKTVQRKHLPY